MPRAVQILVALCGLACGAALPAATPAPARPPLVAIAPASLHQTDSLHGLRITEGTMLPELTQIALQADPASPAVDFVERAAIETLLREQTLALATGSAPPGSASAVRVGRLLHADWILQLRLRADEPYRFRLEAEVTDSLRADLLARADSPLDQAPTPRALHEPPEPLVRLATATAARALAAARDRAALLADRTTLAPLVLANRSGTERLAPLGPRFLAALRTDHARTHALSYAGPDAAFAESALFVAGLTDLDPETWARVADAYLWGEYAEDETYVGPVADTPVSLRIQLWRAGDTPQPLEFTGTLGALDDLARHAAQEVLAAAAGARLAPTPEARRAAATRLVSAAEPLADTPQRRYFTDQETGRAAGARRAHHVELLGLASFFHPEDLALRERYLFVRCESAATAEARARWADEIWRHLDQHLLTPAGTPDLALLTRVVAFPYARHTGPGFSARAQRLGQVLKDHPPTAPVVRELWSLFLGTARVSPDEPGLRPALESLWPLIRRVQPDVTDFSVRAAIDDRQTFARIYRDDPARLRALLTDRLFPLDLSPLPEVAPPPRAAPPPPAPAAPTTFARPSADPANAFTAFQNDPISTLMDLAERGPLANAPELSASTRTLPLWPLEAASATPAHFPPLPDRAFFADFATDGRALWLSLAPPSDSSITWKGRRVARIDLDSNTLSWPAGLADGATLSPSFWRESADEFWFATRGEGLRIVRSGHASPLLLNSSHGLPDDAIFQLRRGHDAIYLAPSHAKDQDPKTLTVTAVGLRDHQVSLRSAATGPDLAALPASTRAAILSFPAEAPRHVLLPEQAAFALPPAGMPPDPPQFARLPEALREKHSPRAAYLRRGGTGAPDDPARPRLALLTGPRDGYWVASPRSVVWASGQLRIPLVHWLYGQIAALADDGRRLFVRVVSDPRLQLQMSDQAPPDPAADRLYVYDYVEGRWLGWLALPANGFLYAGGERLLIALSPHTPLTVVDVSSLREKTAATPAAVVATAPPPRTPPPPRRQRRISRPRPPIHDRHSTPGSAAGRHRTPLPRARRRLRPLLHQERHATSHPPRALEKRPPHRGAFPRPRPRRLVHRAR